jgi:hypothetical protein
MSNRSKSLIIIMILLLLKTMSNKTSLIALKRTVRASLNLLDPLTSDRTNTWGTGHKIPHASLLKSNNFLSHRVLPFRMKNSITIKSWLRKSSGCESWRRVTVGWPAKSVTTSNKLPRGGISQRGGSTGGAHHQWKKKMAHQKRAHLRKLEHLTSVLHDGCRLEPQEEPQRKTQRMVKSSEE